MLLLLAMLATVLAGCGGAAKEPGDPTAAQGGSVTANDASAAAAGESQDAEPGQLPLAKDKVTIEVYADMDVKADADNNEFLKGLAEKTNVTLKVTARPSNASDVSTTKNLLMASNDYPEMFLMNQPASFTMSELVKYGMQDKTFIPLNEYIDKYGYELKKIYSEFPELKKIMVAPDGNIYGLNSANQCGHCMAYPKMWVNMNWLDKLGMKVPETTDEFYSMLKAFKEQDPGGVGAKNVIPLTADIDEPIDCWIVNSFIPYSAKTGRWLTGSNACYADDSNKVVFSADKAAFKEALAYMNKLYKEGLVDIAAFSQTSEQMKQTVMKKPMPVGAISAMHLAQGADLNDKEVYGAYHAIAPVAGPNGVRYQSNVYGKSFVSGNTTAFATITDKCKNPEAAFKVLDYFMNEEVTMKKMWGVEGTDWNRIPAGQKNIRGGEAKYQQIRHAENTDLANSLKDRTFWIGPMLNLISFRDTYCPAQPEDVLNTDPNFYEARLESETIPLEQYFYPRDLPNQLFMTVEETDEFNEIANNINTYVTKSIAQFVIGDKNLEGDWDSYINDLKNFKLDRFLELYQKAFDNFNNAK
jgi:putative aldouronate transport system substrate-binding protein